ncbi:hypothetical protein [Prosthecobacter sp.]|uniref:hypothetical protein n=1 Tax=Prosthecobacter sp. TaxID=1965333 RepID=UPI001D57DBF8|nr:hypothetical protein [Prosthecobacter sp.]MCB1279879.1 hypothetical protein [Prosthecobacter sp.]
MHYRNGREAINGDKVAQLETQSGKVTAIGTLQNATPGNDYCNGKIVVDGGQQYGPAIIIGACMCDCIHIEDLAAILEEKGLAKRPEGK